MNEKTQLLLDRTFNFGVNTLIFLDKLPEHHIYKVPKLQLARSSTSVGSNYEEAQGAVSKRDFANKIGICYKESRESAYWFRVLNKLYTSNSYNKSFESFIQESIELKKIFATIRHSTIDNK